MKSFLNVLRMFIATGSLTGFIGGWVLIAHSNKPVSAAATQPSAQIAPGPVRPQDLIGQTPTQLQPITPLQPIQPLQPGFAPRVMTGGS